MRWPWRRNTKGDKAIADLENAEAALERTRRQWPDVHRAAAAMRQHRARNHFAENLETIYRGGAR